MSLFKVYADNLEGHKEKLYDDIVQATKNAINFAKDQKQKNYDRVFNNSNLTPQQAFDAMGTDAAKFLALSAAMLNVIHLVDPTWVAPVVTQTLTPNQDGTVTVGA